MIAGEVRIDSTNGRTMAGVKGVFDIGYAEFISQKVREKKQELAEQGLPSGGGTRPYGYGADRITVRPNEAEHVREAMRRLLGGDTLTGIARDWNHRGVPTVSGRLWTAVTLRGVVSGARIAGLRQHRGEVVGEAAWPAIVDRQDWQRLRLTLDARMGRSSVSTARRLLTGLLVCGRCGQPLWAGVNNSKPTYACLRREGRPGCFLSIEGTSLEELITDTVMQRMDLARIPIAQPNVKRVAGRVAALEAERDELTEMKARGDLSMAEWKTLRAGVLERLAAARREPAASATDADKVDLLSNYMKLKALRREWPNLVTAQRRQILGLLIGRITITPAVHGRNRFDPERVTVEWKA